MSFEKVGVVVKIRPLLTTEDPLVAVESKEDGTVCAVTLEDKVNSFTFDNVLPPEVTQAQFFSGRLSATVDHFIHGHNAAVIAYGQTASGKTYTMTGGDGNNIGIIPRAIKRIFESKTVTTLGCIFVEVYNDKVYDLLNGRNIVTLKTDGFFKDTKRCTAKSYEQVAMIISRGTRLRSVGTTKMNNASSRSHTILKLLSEKGAELSLVDLAGSETIKKTGANGDVLTEAKSINSSLSALARVVKELSETSQHISYRDSKLTHALRRSFEGESQTTIIINCSPSQLHVRETINSLRFGESAKKIEIKHFDDNDYYDELLQKYGVYAKLHMFGNNIIHGGVPNLEALKEIDDSSSLLSELESIHVEPINRSKLLSQMVDGLTNDCREYKQLSVKLEKRSKEFAVAMSDLLHNSTDRWRKDICATTEDI